MANVQAVRFTVLSVFTGTTKSPPPPAPTSAACLAHRLGLALSRTRLGRALADRTAPPAQEPDRPYVLVKASLRNGQPLTVIARVPAIIEILSSASPGDNFTFLGEIRIKNGGGKHFVALALSEQHQANDTTLKSNSNVRITGLFRAG